MFDRIERLIGRENLSKINDKTVLVVGLGGVGGSCVLSLVRSGIKKVIIVDFDIVDLSNLNRQIITFQDNVGHKKVDVCYETIKKINPDCEVIKYDMFLDSENIKNIFDTAKIDYVVDACDSVQTKKAIILECLKRKIKFISCMGTGNKLNPLNLEIIDIRKTFNDPLAKVMRKWVKDNKINDKIMVLSSREVPLKKDKIIASMCFVPNMAGTLIANYIIKDIIKI